MNLTKTFASIATLALIGTGLTAQSLTTTFAGGNGGGSGWTNQMDWTVFNAIRVTSLDLNASSGSGTIDVYMTAAGGTYVGNELVPGVWTLVGSGSYTSTGQGAASAAVLNSPIIVTPGSYGVAILYNGTGMGYTNGNGSNQQYSNADLQIDLGSSTTGLFTGSRFNPRLWNGTVHYTPASGLFAGFSAAPTAGVSPLNVAFTDSSFSSDAGGITSWGWDFDGNGTIDSALQSPSNTYAGGLWSVALTVKDASHPDATELKTDYIGVDIVVASFSATNTNGPSPLAVVFTDASTGPITLHEWDFDNDGTVDSNTPSPTFTYNAAGKFSVSLKVSNATGSSTDLQADLVVVDPLVASFTVSANAISPGGSVSFTDTTTGNPTAWSWDLDGDGVADSTIQNPSFTYNNAGIFTVTLTASNAAFSEVATDIIEVGTIPMPGYNNTFSSAGATRGYWFVTPVGFSITGLQVPDEQASGLQNVAVAKVQGTSTTTTYDFMFESFAVPAGQIIPSSISFEAGDTVYVLGAGGDAAVMHNSYGSGGPSTVLGQPITLTRAFYQSNIITSPISAGGASLGFATGGSISRVFTLVSDATGVDYGVNSDNGNGLGAPTLTTTALPIVGGNGVLSATMSDSASISAALLIGVGRSGLATPFGIVNVGLIVLDIPVPGFAGAGTYPVPVSIPSSPALIGTGATFQSVVLNPAAPNFFGMSNGTEWVIGSF